MNKSINRVLYIQWRIQLVVNWGCKPFLYKNINLYFDRNTRLVFNSLGFILKAFDFRPHQ